MKHIVMFFAMCIFATLNGYSQSQCETCGWDWLNVNNTPSNSNWIFTRSGILTSPEINSTGAPWNSSVPEINNITLSQDFTPANGWVLLYKDYGCFSGTNYPYFFLYNKFTGKMRLFMYRYVATNTESPFNGGVVTLRWNNPSKCTSLLTFCNSVIRANSYYNSGPIESDDVGIFALLSKNGQWYPNNFFVADFNMAFDPNTSSDNIGYQLKFDVSATSIWDINLSGELDWETRSLGVGESLKYFKDDKTDPDKTDYIYSGIKTIPKVTSSLPSEADLNKVFKEQYDVTSVFETSNNLTAGNTQLTETFKQTMRVLSDDPNNDFVKFLKASSNGLPVFGKYVSSALAVYDYFAGKSVSSPQQIKVMPTVTHGAISLSGKMSAETAVTPIMIDLPGSEHSASQPNKTPLWDCPLGVLSLDSDPGLVDSSRTSGISKRRVPLNCGTSEGEWKIEQIGSEVGYPNFSFTYVPNQAEKYYKSIKINRDLRFALNPTSRVTVNSIKVAIVGRTPVGADGKPTIKCFDQHNFYVHLGMEPIDQYNGTYYWIPTSTSVECKYKEPFITFAERGDYLLNNISNKGLLEVSTPFIDVTKFKNTSITLPEEMEIYLKVIAVLTPIDPDVSQTPVVLTMKYNITEPNYNDYSSTTIYPYTEEEFNNMSSFHDKVISNVTLNDGLVEGYNVSTNGIVNVNATSYLKISAMNQISFNPGFSASASGTGYMQASIGSSDIAVIPSSYTPLNAIVNSNYFFGPKKDNKCNCSDVTTKTDKLDGKNSINDLMAESIQKASELNAPSVYPSVTSGSIFIDNINNISKQPTNIQVYNYMGGMVVNLSITEKSTNIDLSSLPCGLYIVRIVQDNRIDSIKVVKE